MQPDLLDPRDRPKARMTKDKGAARGGHVVTLAAAAPRMAWNR